MKNLLVFIGLCTAIMGCNPQSNQDTVVKKAVTLTVSSPLTTDSIMQDNTAETTFSDWEYIEEKKSTKPIPNSISQTPTGTYSQLKQQIKSRQKYYQASADSVISPELLDSARKEITELLLQKNIPFWYGTEWDFNGYTAVPQQGEIACGYFVSTTLRDLGFKLNRYHLAQQAGYHAALSLQKKRNLHIFKDLTVEALQQKLLHELKWKDGLYFIGLHNHVGYLLIHEKEMYFIHSNYITDKVMIQHVDDSAAFASHVYVIADITHNDALIEKWIRGETIKVIRA